MNRDMATGTTAKSRTPSKKKLLHICCPLVKHPIIDTHGDRHNQREAEGYVVRPVKHGCLGRHLDGSVLCENTLTVQCTIFYQILGVGEGSPHMCADIEVARFKPRRFPPNCAKLIIFTHGYFHLSRSMTSRGDQGSNLAYLYIIYMMWR